ncbi:hypothetical protein DFH07DRAFT_960222 [Mycena maculata]|uniref:Uncharacterized protein n=1 Tax=Mycena maculata TaxID=230809 RepID=A0AAD7IZ25_9AGAR|nr:hypothetical protein DFH07DRAFT_960222 [Mycena maculata]
MPTAFTTIAVETQPHIRHTKPKPRPPLTADERKEKKQERDAKQDAIDAALSKWYDDSLALAEDLSTKYKQKPKYFLEIMFQGGARMVHQQTKTNPYNAFRAEKAAECGESKNAPTLHEDYFDEYKHLTEQEKEALIERFKDTKARDVKLRRDTPRAKIQDVANIARNIKLLMIGLGTRVGVEGFFCIVRNSPDFHMQPQWFFTSRELEQYMPIATRRKWATVEVGLKVEAFCIAGCDVVNLLRTSKQKADFLKSGIREGLSEKLVAITGDPNAQMQYVWYEEDIVHKHSVILVGWTFPEIVNPSELSSSLAPLQTLYNAIKNDECKFVKLSPLELQARKKKWAEDVAAGRIEAKHRATRADKGVKRKRTCDEDDEDSGEEQDGMGNEDDDNDDESPHTTPPKRRRISAKRAVQPIIDEPNSDVDTPPATTPVEKPVAARKPRTTTQAASKAAPHKTAPAKKAAPRKAPRDDEVTRRAAAKVRADSAAKCAAKEAAAASGGGMAPTTSRPRPRPTYTSRDVITSEDERNADPDAEEDEDNDIDAPAPQRHRPAAVTSADERDADEEQVDAAAAGAAAA